MAISPDDNKVTAAMTKEAVAAINALDAAIVKRRAADAEVGKAHTKLAAINVQTATNREELSAALTAFREVAMHW